MATWIIFKRRFYPCWWRGIIKTVNVGSRGLNVCMIAIFLVCQILMAAYSVFTYTDLLDFHHGKPPSKTGHEFLSNFLWFLDAILFARILYCGAKRAQAEMEGRPYRSADQIISIRQQHPQEESGVDLSGTRSPDGRWYYGRYFTLPNYSSRDSIMEETERAVMNLQEERRRMRERNPDYFRCFEDDLYYRAFDDSSLSVEEQVLDDSSPSVEERVLDDYPPTVEDNESDDYSPSVEERVLDDYSPSVEEYELDYYSPSVEECKLDDNTPTTNEGEMHTLMTTQVVRNRSRHPSKSDEQSSSASHAPQDAAVYEADYEVTRL